MPSHKHSKKGHKHACKKDESCTKESSSSSKQESSSSKQESCDAPHQKKCRKDWVEEEQIKVCRKVEITRPEKRCRTVVKYRPVTKTMKITVQEIATRLEERCKTVDDAHCTKVWRWVDVCEHGNTHKDSSKSGCCSGVWIAAKREKVCRDKGVSCPREIKYNVQIPYITERCEFVDVTLMEPYFEQEEYFENVTECDTVCEWESKKFPEPPCPC